MKTVMKLALSLMFLATSFLAIAQEEEEAKKTFIYATYFNCNAALEDAADAEFDAESKPAYDAAREAGVISDWGYYTHHTGGQWRRLTWYAAGSIGDLLKAQSYVQDAIPEAVDEVSANDFGKACKSHDDYIWEVTNGSNVTGEAQQGKASISTYHVCNLVGSDRADEIVATEYAPMLNANVADGTLTGWGWLSHRIGGKIRRIQTMTATDMPALMAATAKIFPAMGQVESGDEFDSICTSHTDYLWNIVH